jgi:hypothetical protein
MLDEAIEAAVIQTARKIAARDQNNPMQAYDSLVSLYAQQPKLSVRTSTSIEQQAYSTPAPLAYLASRLAGISQQTRVYEPSAGNGALLIDARATYVTANELNPDRAAMLRRLFVGATVTEGDAINDNLTPKQFDVVIANPPFGPVKDDAGNSLNFDLGGNYVTREIDHAISMKALDKMADDGRAVLIIGGINKRFTDPKARADAYNGKAKREFFFKLFSQYNVVDHFTVDGSLYERQGAGWPVDLIVINGRGKSALTLPAVRAPRQYDSWQDLAEVLSNGRLQEVTGAIRATDGNFVAERTRAAAVDGTDTGSGGIRADSGRNRSDTNEQPRSVRDGSVDGQSESAGMGDAGAQSAPVSDQRQRRADRNDGVKLDGENARQVSYTPGSGGNAMGTLVPVNMQASIDDALDALRNRVGDIDQFVSRKLGYTGEQLFAAFGAEQIDAIALAVDNIENGAGFIIGDQTGIGKGRVVAAVIRYAIREGRPPIFVTEKPALYKDMFRDMEDIGMVDMLGREINAVMTNSGERIPLDEDETRFLKSATPAKQEALLQKLAAEGLQANDVDVVMTTYAQMQTVKGQETGRMSVLRSLASQGGVLILDESHNAGGTAAGMIQKKEGEAPNRAEFVRELVNKSHGVFYSSATYAKRPDVMDLYAATDMRLAVKDTKDLGEAIAKGGVPMQQVVAAMLARAGQYVRRERSFDGIAYNTPTVEVDMDLYAASADVLASIQDFSELYVGPATDEMSERLKEQAESVSFDGAVGSAGASSTNFTSVMHNVIDQMLLAFSADAAADRAIEAIKNGEKPVITVANTLEAMLKEFADDAGINIGEVIDITFANVFKRYLERTRWISVKKPFAEKGTKAERVYLTDADLGPDGVAAFKNAMELIVDSGLEALPGSPVDYIISRIEEAGYSVGEITGRTLALSYRNGKTYLKSRPSTEKSVAGKIKAIAGFNNGKIDAMLLNRSGSTGLSLHASKTFKDQRKRRMIIAQAEGNIDTHMQMLGRVHRTGQVVLPEYDQIVIGVPAAKRPAAVLAKKMASLNANTTASRDSALTSSDTIDFMNVYGDEVVANLMMEEPDIHYRLAEPLKGKEEGEGYNKEDAARKVTGRIPLLPVAQQEDLYQRIEEEYLAFLEQKNAAGENALEAKTFELDAVTESSTEVVAPNAEGKDSPFGEAVRVEIVDVKRLGKPYPGSEVAQKAADAAGVEVSGSPAETQRNILSVNRPKHVADTREWMEKGRAWHSEDLAKIKDDKARTRAVEKFSDNLTTYRDIRGLVGIGESVKLIAENGNYYGVVTDLRRTGNTKNPLAPGAWKATFAVVDGARSLTFPFSQLMVGRGDTGGKVRLESAENIGQWPIIEAFDKMQSTSREKRTVVTGNMLAGFNYVNGRGSIINYTTDSGDVRQGIMMPKDFDLGKHEAKQPIPLASPEVVLAWLAEVREPLSGDGRSGNKISIFSNPYRNEFTVVAAKSKAKGGEYFLNRGLTDALQTDFVSRSNGMVANTNIINAEAAIQALLSMGVTFEVPGNASQPIKDKAKALVDRIEGAKIKRSVVDDEPIAALTGEEMGKMPQNAALRLKILRDRAINWYRSNLAGKTITASDGAEVTFSRAGMQKSTSRKGEDLLRALPALTAIIETGTVRTLPVNRGGMKAFLYAGTVRIDGKDMRLAAIVREDANGKRHYDLTKDTGKRSIGSPAEAVSAYSDLEMEVSSDADVNLFIVDEEINNEPPANDEKQSILDELQARMQELGIQEKIALRVVDRLGARTAGTFDARWTMDDEKFIRGTISIALEAPQASDFTLNHEAIHAMRSLGLFRDAEWAALSRRAQSDYALMRSIKRRYPGLSKDAQIEEAIADMFAGWKRLRNQKGLAAKAFDRILAFMTALSSWAKGRGWTSAEDVMRAIDSGVQAGRDSGKAKRDGSANSLFDEPAQPEKTMTDKQRAELEARQKQGMARKGGQQGLGDQDGGLFSSERDQGMLFSITDVLDLAGTDPTWKGEMADKFERFRMVTQDRYITLRKVQRKIERAFGRPIPDNMDPYKGEELVHGRIAERLDQLHDKVLGPILDDMADAKVTIDEFETYLYARHAPERNAQIAKINKDMPDKGSGMSNIEAAAIMNRVAKSPKGDAIKRIAKRVDDLREMTINNQVAYGLISADRADELRATYKFYVPLRGFKETESQTKPDAPRRSGGGINVRGPEGKRAFGRRSKADSPLSYLVMQAEEAISRGETNRVAQEFYELAKASPDEDFWKIQKVQYKRRINPDSGIVEDYVVTQLTAEDGPYTVVAKIDGKERRVTMNKNNPSAARLADAMRRLTDSQLDWLSKTFGFANRWLSAVNTRFSPDFIITNLLRDLQMVAINLQGLDVDGISKKAAYHYKGAFAASMRGAFDIGKGDWAKWYKEFSMAGAKTAFARIDNIDAIKSNIEKEFAIANSRAGNNKSAILKLKIWGSKAKDLVENLNDGVENSVRLAVYRASRESGLSEKQAASIAKNITVNFNRRGQMGPAMNALYLFYNASVQGNVRILQAIYHSKKVQAIVGAIVMAGAASDLLNSLISDDDDDGESFYDKIPAYVKERNIIIMHPDGKNYTPIAMPYGYNTFWETGRILTEIGRRGGDRAAQSGLQLLTTYLGAFNAIGFSWEGRSAQEIFVSAIMPTPLDPWNDIADNVNFMGSPIMPEENQFGPQDPDAQRYWPGVDKKWKALTDLMTEATGGNSVEAGWLDVSPETVEYLVNTVFGSVGGLVDRIISIPEKIASGEATAADFPVVRKFTGKKSEFADKSAFFERLKEVEARVDDATEYLESDNMEEFDRFVDDHERVLSLETQAKEARKMARQIRKERRGNDVALEKGNISAAEHKENEKILDEAEKGLITEFNRQWVSTVYKARE